MDITSAQWMTAAEETVKITWVDGSESFVSEAITDPHGNIDQHRFLTQLEDDGVPIQPAP